MSWKILNWLKTGILLSVLSGLFMAFGYYFGGNSGLVIAGIFAIGMNFFSYWFSDKIVLAMHHAKEMTREDSPELYDIVSELANRAGIPVPKIFLVPDESPNAFATGRNPSHAVVAVNQGLLNLLNREELRGVLAHEISHIKHRDILISTIAATVAAAIMMFANMVKWAAIFGGLGGRDDDNGGNIFGALAIAIVAPLVATIIQLAISRSREYLADATGSELAGSSAGLISALKKLGEYSGRIKPRYASETMEHMYIVNPFSGNGLAKLFSTHPPLEDRIEHLKKLAAERGEYVY